MHEMALTLGVVRVLEEQAAVHGFARIRTVRLELGELSHAEPEAIRFCFAAASRGTVAEGSRLDMIRVPGSAWCTPCARTVALAQRFDPCPSCGGHDLAVTGGEEMRVKEIEVE